MPSRWLSPTTCLLLLAATSSVGMGSVYSELVINNTDPVIYWNQDETSGAQAADLVGGDNPGTYGGTHTLGQAGPRPSDGFRYRHMDADNKAPSVTANGYTVYTSLTTGAGASTGAYSVQTWFNSTVDDFNDRVLQYVFARGDSAVAGEWRDAVYIYGSWTGVSPKPTGRLVYPKGGGALAVGDTVLSPDTWNHLVFVRDGSATNKTRVYLNGELEIEDTSGWTGTTGEHLTAGHRTDYSAAHGGLGLWGRYDEVAVWDRALAAGEVRQLFMFASVVPEPSSIVVWLIALAACALFVRRRKR